MILVEKQINDKILKNSCYTNLFMKLIIYPTSLLYWSRKENRYVCIERIEVEGEILEHLGKCIKQLVLNVEKKLKFLSNQMVPDLFTVRNAIVNVNPVDFRNLDLFFFYIYTMALPMNSAFFH